MARMRFRSRPRPRSIIVGISADDRQPEHLGDVLSAPAEPPGGKWSLSSYPYPDPTRDDVETENP